MPRIVFLGIYLLVAMIPFVFFGALRSCSAPPPNQTGASYDGPGFYFFGYNSRGRGYSSGGYQGGGFSFGK